MPLPTGHLLRAARSLAGLTTVQLAKAAGIDPSTVSRLESFGPRKVGGSVRTLDAVIEALRKRGVLVDSEAGAVALIRKPKR